MKVVPNISQRELISCFKYPFLLPGYCRKSLENSGRGAKKIRQKILLEVEVLQTQQSQFVVI